MLCLNFLIVEKNDFIKKIRFILKSMTSQPGRRIIAIHILPNISRSKGNQTMKFGRLIEYSMKTIFFEKTYAKCGGNNYSQTLF